MLDSMLLIDDAALIRSLDELAANDAALAAARARLGDPPLRRWPEGFGALLEVILGQQVSTASARAIRTKLAARIGPATPEGVLDLGEDGMRACGFSRQKIAYATDLARRTASGEVDFDGLRSLEDEAAIALLTRIKGIGRWTAEIYLLFALGRPDIWPADDLGIALGIQHLHGLPERPVGKAARAAGDSWRPRRGAGAFFLWHYYHHVTGRDLVGREQQQGTNP